MTEELIRNEAAAQYAYALRLGKKYVSACAAKGTDPYPEVLEDVLSGAQTRDTVNIGLVDIPSELIVGTWAGGRKSAFAGNFMPLLESNSEFADKWITLCASHLTEGGIRDAIVCYEYLGKFYVQEGHKRVSVLKSYDAPSISGNVTRVMPAPSDAPEIVQYYEFLRFYRLSGLYGVSFSQSGGYMRLLAALGRDDHSVWPQELRRAFIGEYRSFKALFDEMNGEKLPLTAGDALVMFLQVHSFDEMNAMTSAQKRAALSALWPDLKLSAQGEPISVATRPEQKEKSLLERIFGTEKLRAAFIYDFDPETSAWASAHARGQQYAQQQLEGKVDFVSCVCPEDPDAAMEEEISHGANVLFATSPMLIDSCRRVAARHKGIAVFNCSLSLPYAGVRSYYCRIYESKFIAGAIAGMMAGSQPIGYVANYPIMGESAAINAFALGARLTNPGARVLLKWTCLEGDPIAELTAAGARVISDRDEDGARPDVAVRPGTYKICEDGQLASLCSPRWNWGIFYEKTLRSLMNAGPDALRDEERAVNDWWGLGTGSVDVDISDSLPAGAKQLAHILKNGIATEKVDPFACEIRMQDGSLVSDGTRVFTLEELMRMDWLCDNITGSIPDYELLKPMSRRLVRLLGLRRESIPPLAGDM